MKTYIFYLKKVDSDMQLTQVPVLIESKKQMEEMFDLISKLSDFVSFVPSKTSQSGIIISQLNGKDPDGINALY